MREVATALVQIVLVGGLVAFVVAEKRWLAREVERLRKKHEGRTDVWL